jgi:hypothetical protein
MFNQKELQLLLGGVNTPIDIDDLRRNTNYGGLYGPQQPTIVAFWRVRPRRFDRCLSLTDPLFVSFQVVEGFDAEQRRALLRFVTSVGRPPLLYVSSERHSHVARTLTWIVAVVALVALFPSFPSVTQEATKIACRRRALA